jgi:hypothetical protein
MNLAHRLLLAAVAMVMAVGWMVVPADRSQQLRNPLPGPAVLSDGEELVYEVSWTVFKLGTIRLWSRPDLSAEAHIDSYEDLPFVDLHSIHTTRMDPQFFSRASAALELKENGWWGLEYTYDLPDRRVFVAETMRAAPDSAPSQRSPLDTIALADTSFVDGLAIAYYPRRFVQTGQTVEVPTLLYGKLGMTTFHFPAKPTSISIDAVDDPVRVREVEGSTSVVGIFGMTGAFTGWFSDDAAAVPIKGTLKVLLGTVDIELVSWKRSGWSPPVAD